MGLILEARSHLLFWAHSLWKAATGRYNDADVRSVGRLQMSCRTDWARWCSSDDLSIIESSTYSVHDPKTAWSLVTRTIESSDEQDVKQEIEFILMPGRQHFSTRTVDGIRWMCNAIAVSYPLHYHPQSSSWARPSVLNPSYSCSELHISHCHRPARSLSRMQHSTH
jgi:hypothetical protein